jgi:phosphatidylglycerophosphate synthase
MSKKNESQKSLDDIYALIFSRPISKRISPTLTKYNITPNQISILGILIGITGAFLIILGNNIIAAIIIYLSFIADCIDGEIARIKKQFTKFGYWLESSLDSISLLSALLAIGYISKEWMLTSLAISTMLMTRIRMLASDTTSLKFNLKIKNKILKNNFKKTLWQLRYGNSLQYMILIIPLIFKLYTLSLYLTILFAGGYYFITTIYEIKYYHDQK